MPYLFQIVVPSFLEALTVLAVLFTINNQAKLGKFQTIVYASLFSTTSYTLDYLQVPFHLLTTIIVSIGLIILLKRPARKRMWLYAIDVVTSIIAIFIIQLVITVVAGLFNIDILANEIVIIIILILIIVFFVWLSSKSVVRIFFEKFYYPYRIAILFSTLSFVFIITIIGDIYFYYRHLFSVDGADRFVIVIIGYFVLNTFFGVNLFRVSIINQEKTAVKGYGEHLQNIINSNRAAFHDTKHHLNIINSFNRTQDGDVIIPEQDEYIKALAKEGIMGDTSVIKDDVLLSAMLHQKKEYAKQKNIDFSVSIASSLSYYPIPRSDLANILINLINNAFEAVENMDITKRIVQLYFFDKYIEIRNRVSVDYVYSDADTSKQIIKQGYSTKGPERGFGLSNVFSTVEKYGIRFSNKLENDMLVQELEFPKE